MLLFAFPYIHIGSLKDLLRWCRVVPFYCGMLLTSILALKHAPMSLVIVMRNASPLVALMMERFYPEPIRISRAMVAAIVMMVLGALMYVSRLSGNHWQGVGWVFLNSAIAVADRLLQRLLLSKDQKPVDISKSGITFINNAVVFATLSSWDQVYILLTCLIGLSICYTGIWAQSLISATSFLVMVNANKFLIIGIEAFGMHTKVLTLTQLLGATLSIVGGVCYGRARQQMEDEVDEQKTLLAKDVPNKVV